MSAHVLDPVPTGPEEPNGGNHDEYWLNEDSECYLKLDFHDSTYTISWRTNCSSEEFLPLLDEIGMVVAGNGLVTVLADERDYRSVPVEDFLDRRIVLPAEPGIVKYVESPGEGDQVEVEWFEHSGTPYISVTSDDPDITDEFESVFEETADTRLVEENTMQRAYNEAVEKIRQRVSS